MPQNNITISLIKSIVKYFSCPFNLSVDQSEGAVRHSGNYIKIIIEGAEISADHQDVAHCLYGRELKLDTTKLAFYCVVFGIRTRATVAYRRVERVIVRGDNHSLPLTTWKKR